jgi:organic hydroperoxide reductase OsmC/OhrA
MSAGRHEYSATVEWRRQAAEPFSDNRYSRAHRWRFDGGAVVPASSSPLVVPLPYSAPANVDPEEAFVAALSSCHMLFFLSYAARQGYVVESYEDQALGVMGRDERRKEAMLKVCLRPRIVFSGDRQPTPQQIEALHHRSHEDCYIANSVRTEVVVENPL